MGRKIEHDGVTQVFFLLLCGVFLCFFVCFSVFSLCLVVVLCRNFVSVLRLVVYVVVCF